MKIRMMNLLWQRAMASLTTFPATSYQWYQVAAITVATTATAGIIATATQFIHPVADWNPPSPLLRLGKPCLAFFVPALVEEVFWRGMLLPRDSLASPRHFATTAMAVLVWHVASHPVWAYTVWPRGRTVFDDPRFLLLATIVLGGSTWAYYVSGGSVWAAAIPHGMAVALWRDFFSGEQTLSKA